MRKFKYSFNAWIWNALSSLVPVFQKNIQQSASCGSEPNLANLYSTGIKTVHCHQSKDYSMYSKRCVSNMHSRMIIIPHHQKISTDDHTIYPSINLRKPLICSYLCSVMQSVYYMQIRLEIEPLGT